jgi:hypothetical protein
VRGDITEDSAVESVRQRAPREVAGKGVRFSEIMRARSHQLLAVADGGPDELWARATFCRSTTTPASDGG